MKVFVATDPSDGQSEFAFTVPGELVHLPVMICKRLDCGCERAMGGFASHKATTSFVVRDLPLDLDTYSHLLFDSLADGGWVNRGSNQDLEWARDWAIEHAELAAKLPSETPLLVERRQVWVRRDR